MLEAVSVTAIRVSQKHLQRMDGLMTLQDVDVVNVFTRLQESQLLQKATRCSLSLEILISRSRSLNVIRNCTVE